MSDAWSATCWLPVTGRPVTCRRDDCHEPAIDDLRQLCPAHRWGQPRRAPVVERKVTNGLPSRRALPGAGPWADRAACRDRPDVDWFPESQSAEALAMAETAKAICAGCQVRADCLEAGLEEKYGVWGGTSARERARLRKLGRLEAA